MDTSPLGALARADIRVLARDPLLPWMLLLPLALAWPMHVFVPIARDAVLAQTGTDLAPYYPLLMGGYAMTAPGMVGMITGFMLLDERDARTLTALRVTPLSMRRYMAFRIAGPLAVATASTLVGYLMIDLTPIPLSALLGVALVGGLSAPLVALVLAAAAANKVAGLAVVKVLNAITVLPIAAAFLPLPIQYVAGIIPTYWPMRALWSAAAGEAPHAYLAVGAATTVAAMAISAWLFERRLERAR
jgi:fluoroquinolone transport system permease protein